VSELKEKLREVQEQNGQLQQQLGKQQQLIEVLTEKVSALEQADKQRAGEYQSLKSGIGGQTAPATAETKKPFAIGKAIISAEGGLAFFHSERKGKFPNAESRVDEAKLFLDAPIWDDVYFFAELNLTRRESPSENVKVGELYLDFENVSRLWNQDRMLNVRVGRFDTPFGEEYLVRDAIDNPLIAHSLSDLWAVDEGIGFYGRIGKVDYAVAVQNGGDDTLHDFDADKAVAGRVGCEPKEWLRVSASAMRTGDLNQDDDFVSAMWIGNGFFRALGDPATTETFHAELFEGDVQLRFPRGHFKAAGGYAHFDDDDSAADNERDIYFYYVEGLYEFTRRFYGAARFSQMLVQDGYPLVGLGDFGKYFFQEQTENLWLLTVGGGYRWSRDLILKAEYNFQGGEEVGGGSRDHENMFAVELAFRF